MKNRDMLMAEAVRDAIADKFSGEYTWLTNISACVLSRSVDLPAIIASVPAPEPVAYMHRLEKITELSFFNETANCVGRHDYIGSIPLYAAPPAVEINQQLLDALKTAERYVHDDFIAAGIGQVIAAAEKEIGK